MEELKLFCDDCSELICRDCALVKHRTHKYNFASDPSVLSCQKTLTEEKLKQVSIAIGAVSQTQAEAIKLRQPQREAAIKAGEQLSQLCVALRQTIDTFEKRQRDLINHTNKCDDHLTLLSSRLKELNGLQVLIPQVLQEQDSCTFLQQAKPLHDQIKNALQIPEKLLEAFRECVEFDSESAASIQKAVEAATSRLPLSVSEQRQTPTKFTAWRNEMITFSNTSHTPEPSSHIKYVSGQPIFDLAWDHKDSGTATFEFDQPILMIQVGLYDGSGSKWDVQYGDTLTGTFTTVAQLDCTHAQWNTVQWQGKPARAARVWRLALKSNGRREYMQQFEWYFVK